MIAVGLRRCAAASSFPPPFGARWRRMRPTWTSLPPSSHPCRLRRQQPSLSMLSSVAAPASSASDSDSDDSDDDDGMASWVRSDESAQEFPLSAPSAPLVFYRAYSRRRMPSIHDGDDNESRPQQRRPPPRRRRETFAEAASRTVDDVCRIGSLTPERRSLLLDGVLSMRSFPSGRALWVAGTPWSRRPENASGYYNCTSTNLNEPDGFGLLMDLAMMGCGTGVVLEERNVANLPVVRRGVRVERVTELGTRPRGKEETILLWDDEGDDCSGKGGKRLHLQVGDSRKGWVDAYQCLIDLAYGRKGSTDPLLHAPPGLRLDDDTDLILTIDLSEIRPPGSPLRGFGGMANPALLGSMFRKVSDLLTSAKGRKLTSVEACLLVDEAAAAVVAGNIRRSAGMRQFAIDDEIASNAKANLYVHDETTGSWSVDPKREALRLANHTRVAHRKPTLDEVTDAVRMQYQTGEGAIQYAPEAVARANADLFCGGIDDDGGIDEVARESFLRAFEEGPDAADSWMREVAGMTDDRERRHRLERYGLNPCGEIVGCDFHCNLSEVHLNRLDPDDREAQATSFYTAGLQAAALLKQRFPVERFRYSRDVDPIVGVSFTGLFDFFVHALGKDWLHWMLSGRGANPMLEAAEADFLRFWRAEARRGVAEYCNEVKLRVPNRVTCVQPAGTKSLLTGASPGWHPPKAAWFLRRITLPAYDPVALAAIDYGYSVIPAPSARDDSGRLLDDIHDPRSTEWLVEVPTEVSWAGLVDDDVDLSSISAEAQFGLYMSVQTHYTDHNTSATIEFREEEIKSLAHLIHRGMGRGYISAALLARFDAHETFPRMPFEPLRQARYKELMEGVLSRRVSDDFGALLELHDGEIATDLAGGEDGACTSASCLAKGEEMERKGLVIKSR